MIIPEIIGAQNWLTHRTCRINLNHDRSLLYYNLHTAYKFYL